MTRKLMMMATVVVAAIGAWAETETVGGYTWTYRINGDTAEIFNNYSAAISPSPTGDVTIPSTLGGKSVTSIGIWAFRGCSGLTSVTMPDSVDSIGNYAFSNCSGLTSVTIPNSVTSIGITAFYGCSSLTSVTIPNSVTNIGTSAFYGCSSLTSVTIPSSVTSIDWSAFRDCSGLTSVTIPGSVTNIDDYAFSGCIGLTSVTMPDSVASIGEGAFYGCSGLTSVTIPNSVTSIGDEAFRGCGGLTSVTMPDSVASIGMGAFCDCGGLTSVTIPNGVTSIGPWAFSNCSGLQAFVVSNANPYYKSENGLLLTIDGATLVVGVNGDVTIPSSVTSIGNNAFNGCIGLTSVTIPNSVTSIEHSAFSGCIGLTSVTIPNSVTSIGSQAFDGCSGLTSVTIPNDVTSIKGFSFCIGLTSVTIPYGATSIEEEAFYGCSSLTSVTIPSSVTSIGGAAFDECSSLTSVYVSPGDADRVRKLMADSGFYVSGVNFIEGTWFPDSFDTNGGNGGPVPGLLPGPEDIHQINSDGVGGVVPTTLASEYNGYLYDANSGGVKGAIQVKVGKPGKDGAASVKATVQLGAKKVTLKAKDKGKAVINPNGPTEIELVGGEACEIVLGAEGISGTYSKYFIDGARNFFTSKDKAEAGAANAALGKWLGAVNVVWDGGSVNIAIAKKGKAKVKGTLADGKTKISVNSMFLVGEEWCCVPVAAPKANLAFTVWMPSSGGNVVVDGLGDSAVAGKAGTLRPGSKFRIDGAAFTGVLPYLPDGVSVEQQGTKWVVAGGAKAGKVVYKDGMVDESKLGENPSGLKLSYKAKDGSFKGSFKVYAVDGSKVKATTVTITGVLVNGVGYGAATIKDKGSVAVTIE